MFILGLLSGVVFFIVVLAAVYLGYRLGHKKAKPPDVDEEQKKKAEQLKKHFSNLMSYNVETALSKKVNK